MVQYLLRRLLLTVPTVLGISVVLFSILALAPGDPFEELALTHVGLNLMGLAVGNGAQVVRDLGPE